MEFCTHAPCGRPVQYRCTKCGEEICATHRHPFSDPVMCSPCHWQIAEEVKGRHVAAIRSEFVRPTDPFEALLAMASNPTLFTDADLSEALLDLPAEDVLLRMYEGLKAMIGGTTFELGDGSVVVGIVLTSQANPDASVSTDPRNDVRPPDVLDVFQPSGEVVRVTTRQESYRHIPRLLGRKVPFVKPEVRHREVWHRWVPKTSMNLNVGTKSGVLRAANRLGVLRGYHRN